MRWLDGRSDVEWLVAQPVLLHFLLPGRRRPLLHTPDLLSQHEDGSVTLWDARPAPRQDETFLLKTELTAEECRKVGWRHEVFEGHPNPMRMNLLWLNGYRRPMPWHGRWISELESLLLVRPRTVEDIRARDDGSGELIASMWHLVATSRIECDLSVPILGSSRLWWRLDGADEDAGEWGQPAASKALDRNPADALLRSRLRRASR